jgi:hypothetical protein
MTRIRSADLRDVVIGAIQVYNKYRSPDAKATLVRMKNDRFVVDFEGSFCESCSVREYIEDLIYELKGVNQKFRVELQETKAIGQNKFRANYKLKDLSDVKINDEIFFQEFLSERGLTFSEYLASNSCTKDVLLFHFRTWLFEKKQEAST